MLKLKCGDGTELEFDNAEGLAAWVAEERSRMSWATGRDGLNEWSKVRSQFERGWKELEVAAKTGAQEPLERAWRSTYGEEGALIRSDSPEGVALIKLAAEETMAANAVLAALLRAADLGKLVNQSHTSKAFYSAAAMTASLLRGIPAVASAELESLRQSGRTKVRELTEATKEIDVWRKKAAATLQNQEDQWNELRRKSEQESVRLVEHARSEFEETKKYFTTELGLRAPVTYWASEQKSGQQATRWSGIAFFGALTLSVASLMRFAEPLRDFADVAGSAAPARLAILVAGGTLVFWLLRMLARIFLSNYHRTKDAGERVTMLKTFLALLQEQRIEGDMIGLALSAVFRPGSTGLVKDDAAPETGLTAWLSRDKG